MTRTRPANAIILVVTSTLSALLLFAGCAAADSSRSEPTDDSSAKPAPSAAPSGGVACDVATTRIDDATSRFRELQSSGGNDPTAISSMLRVVETDLASAELEVDDADVAEALARATTAAGELADRVDGAAGGGSSVDEVTAAATELQESFAAVGELCG